MGRGSGARVLAAGLLMAAVLVGGCTSANSPGGSPTTTATIGADPSTTATSTPSIEDQLVTELDRLDSFVRSTHVSPFTIHPRIGMDSEARRRPCRPRDSRQRR